MKKPVDNPVLRTWVSLNESVVEADEPTCQRLLREELTGRRRKMFVRRIHSRLNRLRAARERQELNRRMGIDE